MWIGLIVHMISFYLHMCLCSSKSTIMTTPWTSLNMTGLEVCVVTTTRCFPLSVWDPPRLCPLEKAPCYVRANCYDDYLYTFTDNLFRWQIEGEAMSSIANHNLCYSIDNVVLKEIMMKNIFSVLLSICSLIDLYRPIALHWWVVSLMDVPQLWFLRSSRTVHL